MAKTYNDGLRDGIESAITLFKVYQKAVEDIVKEFDRKIEEDRKENNNGTNGKRQNSH